MSELKRHHINEVMDMHNLTRGEMGYSFVYYADDVDKVIAELDRQIKFLKMTHDSCENCNTCAEGMGKVFDENLNKLKEQLRHHKYKRCLAMAKWCRLRGRLFGACGLYEKELWALKWHKRWLELAEKFKEAKL